MTNPPVVVVGSVNMDLVATAFRIPVPGETVTASSFNTYPGGKGANQAVAIAKLGWPVHFIGKIGTDGFGQSLLAALREAGVDTSAVSTVAGPSGVALITTDAEGQNAIVVSPGANAHLSAGDILLHRALIASAGMVLAQLEVPLPTILQLAKLCSELGVPLMLDPAPATILPRDLLTQLAWITPNESEVATLTGRGSTSLTEDDPAECAEVLSHMGARNVLLKRGRRGCFIRVAHPQRCIQVDSFQVTAVDTTAAGDEFNGAFAVALLRGMDVAEAAAFAGAAAAISVTRHGAQSSMPTSDELSSFLSTARRPRILDDIRPDSRAG